LLCCTNVWDVILIIFDIEANKGDDKLLRSGSVGQLKGEFKRNSWHKLLLRIMGAQAGVCNISWQTTSGKQHFLTWVPGHEVSEAVLF
jgi:hypothetical protein